MANASHRSMGKNLWQTPDTKAFAPSCSYYSCINQGDWIFDPFSGSSTTGIAANLCGRRFAGIEQEEEFCKLSKARREEIENLENYNNLISHIEDLHKLQDCSMVSEDISGNIQIPF